MLPFSQGSSIICVRWQSSHHMLSSFLDFYLMQQSKRFIYHYACRAKFVALQLFFLLMNDFFLQQKFNNKVCTPDRCYASCSTFNKASPVCCWLTTDKALNSRDYKTKPFAVYATWICEYKQITCWTFNWWVMISSAVNLILVKNN